MRWGCLTLVALAGVLSAYADDSDSFGCNVCMNAFKGFDAMVESRMSKDVIRAVAVPVCEYLVRPRMPDGCDPKVKGACKELCKGVINMYDDDLVDVFTSVILGPRKVCEQLGACPHNGTKPAPVFPKVNLKDGEKRHASGVGSFIHMTDVHFDNQYAVGSEADCGLPLCCREENGMKNVRNAAGKWGNALCDTNYRLLHSLLEQVAGQAPRFIVWTGDGPPHDVWEQTKDGNLDAIVNITLMVQDVLPSTLVFPVIGNHAAAPVNDFRGPLLDAWLYSPLADAWAPWLDDDAETSLRWGGFYTMLAEPGLRVVSLNTNLYSPDDFFLKLPGTTVDEGSQIAWLKEVLRQAFELKEKVYIIGHSPVNRWRDDFAAEYNNLVLQYSDIIAAQLWGHTHHDEFYVLRDAAGQPAQVAFVAPAVTPFQHGSNPAFRVFQYARNDSKLLDYTQFNANLDDANTNDRAEWLPSYSCLDEYGLTELSAAEFERIGTALRTDESLLTTFLSHYHGGFAVEKSAVDVSCLTLSATRKQLVKCKGADTGHHLC